MIGMRLWKLVGLLVVAFALAFKFGDEAFYSFVFGMIGTLICMTDE